MNAPGTCVDCGNEAYIRLAGETETMICAHCFSIRHPADQAKPVKIQTERSSPRSAKREVLPARQRAAG